MVAAWSAVSEQHMSQQANRWANAMPNTEILQGGPDYKKQFRVKKWPNFDPQGHYKKIGFFLVIE